MGGFGQFPATQMGATGSYLSKKMSRDRKNRLDEHVPVITTALHVHDDLVERWTEGHFLLHSTQKVRAYSSRERESVAHCARKSSCASWSRYLLQPLKTNELLGSVLAGTQMADP